jgi:hypothetical protein
MQICGLDSNILPGVIQLKLDLILLFSEMAACGALSPMVLKNNTTPHPSRVVSLDWRAPLALENGGTTNALAILWHYHAEAVRYLTRYGRSMEVLDQLAAILREFKDGEEVPDTLYGKVDWVTKLIQIRQRESKSEEPLTYLAAEAIHLVYQSFIFSSKGLCVPLRLMQMFGPANFIRDSWKALITPPPRTRAAARGRILEATGRAGHTQISVNWGEVAVNGKKLKLVNPTSTQDKWVQQFIDLIVFKEEDKMVA